MSVLSGIQQHYDFWDLFVRDWTEGRYITALHLPEPWWGWRPEDGELHSVTVNLNPGAGGKLQTRRCMKCLSCGALRRYSDMMYDGSLRYHLSYSEQWHLMRRYRPLMLAIGADERYIAGDTRHHLSVELAPFHDSVSNDIYRKESRADVVKHTLAFAAEAAKLIVYPGNSQTHSPLRNTVIVRASFDNIKKIAGEGVIDCSEISIDNSGKPQIIHSFRLKGDYKDLSDVNFVCLTAARNNLPGKDNLKEIINLINNKSIKQ